MDETEVIIKSLEPLFGEAEKHDLWFYTSYQGIWFHPSELREKHKEEKFLWGPSSWQLRDPDEKLLELLQRRKNIDDEIKSFKERMSK